jgi:hypothetical protein
MMAQIPGLYDFIKQRSDAVKIVGDNGDIVLMSQQEADKIIDELMSARFDRWIDNVFNTDEHDHKVYIEQRMSDMEQRMIAYLEHKFDEVAQSVLERVIMRKFNEEVEARVNKKIREHREKF